MDASWCMRRSKDLESGAPDKIRTRDLSLQSAASLQQRLRPMRPSPSPHRRRQAAGRRGDREQEIVALNSKANVRY